MNSYYVYGHVKEYEARKFEKYSMIERQLQYVKKVIRNKPTYGVIKLKNTLVWKFGKCILDSKIIKELRSK